MALLNMIKKNEIALTMEDYTFLILGNAKSGKSSLYANLIQEFYGDATKGLLIPFEKGYRAIKDVQVFPYTIQPKTVVEGRERDGWGVFVELVQELVDSKEENGIKMLCIDTIDEFFEVATAEVIRQSFIKDKKKVATLNEAFGGFARGTKVLARIVTEQIEKLKNAGYGIVFIGHTKFKSIKLKGTDEEFNMFGSNLTDNIFSIIANSVDMITMITIEKNIVNGIVQGEERRIRFRDDGFYLAGSRFDNLPDTIPYGAKNFKDAYIKAIREKTAKSDDKFEEHLKAQEKIKEAKAREFINSEKAKVLDKEALIEKLKEVCKTDKRVASELMKIVQEHGISLATPKLISDDMFDLIMQQTGVRP